MPQEASALNKGNKDMKSRKESIVKIGRRMRIMIIAVSTHHN